MKCPFKKETIIRNSDYAHPGGYTNHIITEDFQDCILQECAMWNRSEKICGLPLIPSNIDLTKPILD